MVTSTQFATSLSSQSPRLEEGSEILDTATWQNRLSSTIAAYNQWHPTDFNDASLPVAVADWVKATTPEMVHALPTNQFDELLASTLYTKVIQFFLQLEEAYRNQNILSIQKLRFFPSSSEPIPDEIVRNKLSYIWIENRRKADIQVEAGVQYYDDILSSCWSNGAYTMRYELSDKECADLCEGYDIIGWHACRPELKSFLKIRTCLKTSDIDLPPTLSVCDLYENLSDDDKKFFENKYSIPAANWQYFWTIYETCMRIQLDCAQYDVWRIQGYEGRTELKRLVAHYDICKSLAGERLDHYDTISSLVLRHAPEALRPYIENVRKLIHYDHARSALERQLATFQNLQQPFPEQQQAHCRECDDCIQKMETFIHGGCTIAAFSMIQNAFRDISWPISTILIQYKTELTCCLQDDQMRKTVIHNLARHATTCSRAELDQVRAHLRILYPDHSARLNCIAPAELQYATLLYQFERYIQGSRPRIPDSIPDAADIARDLNASQSYALLTEFPQRFPIFYKHFSKNIHYSSGARELIIAIVTANLQLACRSLESSDAAIRAHSLFAMSEMLALENGIQRRDEVLEQLRTNYPAFRDLEATVLYIELAIKFTDQLKSILTTSSSLLINCQELGPRMNFDQCRAFVETLYLHIPQFEQRFPPAVFENLNIWMKYISHIQRLACMPYTEQGQCLDDIQALSDCSVSMLSLLDTLKDSQQGRNLLRYAFAAQLEVLYKRLQAVAIASDDERQNSIVFRIGTLLMKSQDLHTRLLEKSVGDHQILDTAILTTLAQRYPSPIQKDEMECTSLVQLMARYKNNQQSTTADELIQQRKWERAAFSALKAKVDSMGSARFATCITRIQDYLLQAPEPYEFKQAIRAIIRGITTSELEYEIHYRLSTDHYDRVRLDDTIPPLPATVTDPDTTLREGLTNLFNAIPFSELQGQLHDKAMTREAALETLTTYTNNVINHARLLAAPNPTTHPALAKAFWGSIKQIIINIILYIQNHEQPSQSPEKLQKKKIEFLARIIGTVGHCGGRYKADAVTLYQEIVVGVPKTFLSAIARELNDMREANARILSPTDNEQLEPHEFMGFLHLVGHELAIRGTPAANEPYEDPFLTQTRIYATYNNNREGLRLRFEELYTPFAIISCIQQAVGPHASQDMRDLFWEWCYDKMPIPQDWGAGRERSDWGTYYDDICAMDAAKLELARLSSPEAITKYLKSQGIQCKSDQTPEQAIVACELDITKRAYLDAHMYELHPREWSMTNRAAQLRVKQAFIAKMLVQMRIISFNG